MGKKRNSLDVLQEQNHDSETSKTASQLKSRAAKTVVQEFLNESNQNNENGKKRKKKKGFYFVIIINIFLTICIF